MEKKRDFYNYLADVYLNPAGRETKQALPHSSKSPLTKKLFKIGIAVTICIAAVIIMVIFKYPKQIPASTAGGQRTLILTPDPVKLNYNFDLAEKENVTFDLRGVNLKDFKIMEFRVRKSSYWNNLHMNVEFVSKFGERSQFYIKQISNRWQDFKIQLSEFKEISNWSGMQQLLFIVEEWNAQVKKGTIYIDGIRFLK